MSITKLRSGKIKFYGVYSENRGNLQWQSGKWSLRRIECKCSVRWLEELKEPTVPYDGLHYVFISLFFFLFSLSCFISKDSVKVDLCVFSHSTTLTTSNIKFLQTPSSMFLGNLHLYSLHHPWSFFVRINLPWVCGYK